MDKLLIQILPKEDNLVEVVNFSPSLKITGITDDSRKVERGYLFVARQGLSVKGEDFIPEAIKKGASAILRETPLDPHLPITQIRVKNLKALVGDIVLNFYERPEKKLVLIGITGTNGKSSTSFFLTTLLRTLGCRAGYLGTLYYDLEEILPARETTPSIFDVAPLLKKSVDKGIKYVVMEVSSHALDQDRIFPLKFDVAAFTNLSRDHLEYHKDMEAYFQAKKKLFVDYLKREGRAIISFESEYGRFLTEELISKEILEERQILRVNDGDLQVKILERYPRLILSIKRGNEVFKVETSLLGDYQAKNVATFCGCALALGFQWREILEGLKSLSNPPGRLELCGKKGSSLIFVDYAHTPSALEEALKSLLPLKRERLIVLFGCGGNRDTGKRPLMGKVASDLADMVILTSDNPRFEDPIKIIEDIKAGIDEKKVYISIPDRKLALEYAISILKDGDILLVAGKGHEDYQEIAGQRYPFSDKEEIKRILKSLDGDACLK